MLARLFLAFLALAAAVLLLRALVTRAGVGPLEYLTGALLIVLLGRLGLGAARSALRG